MFASSGDSHDRDRIMDLPLVRRATPAVNLQRMAANDFTTQVNGRYQGIFAELGRANNATIRTQAQVLKDIQQSAQRLASSSEELTATSHAMATSVETLAQAGAAPTVPAQFSDRDSQGSITYRRGTGRAKALVQGTSSCNPRVQCGYPPPGTGC